MAIADRFWPKVDRSAGPDGCWPWQAARRNGYGVIYAGAGRVDYAHRVAYELLVGPIPVGLELDHVGCQNPPCVNPAHLEPVTHRVNILRGRAPAAVVVRQGKCQRGHPRTAENLRIRLGHGQCRPCQAEYAREHRRQMSAARRAA